MEKKMGIWAGVALAAVCVALVWLAAALTGQAKDVRKGIGNLREDLAQVTREAKDYQDAYECMRMDYLTMQGSLDGAEAARDAAEAEKKRLEKEMEALGLEAKEARERAALRETEAKKVREELEGYKEQYDNLAQYVVSLENVLQAYAEDPGAEERLAVIGDLQTRLAESETEADALRGRARELEEMLTQAEEAYAGAYALLQENGRDSEQTALEAQELRAACVALKEELTQAQTELAGQSALLTEARRETQETEAALRQAQIQCAKLNEEADGWETKEKQYKEGADELRAEIARLEESLTQAQQYAAGRDSLLKEAQDRARQLETENAKLRKERSEANLPARKADGEADLPIHDKENGADSPTARDALPGQPRRPTKPAKELGRALPD